MDGYLDNYGTPKPLLNAMREFASEGWGIDKKDVWIELANKKLQEEDFEAWLRIQRV